MLAKRKRTFLLFACLFVITAFLGDRLFMPSGLVLLAPEFPATLANLVLAGLLAVAIVLAANAPFITGLPEAEYGLVGLLRWGACGLFTGLLAGLLQRMVDGLSERNFFRAILETFGGIAIFGLVFWLVFRRNAFTMTSESTQKPRILAWLLLVAGMVILTGGLLVAAGLTTWDSMVLFSIGFWLTGIGLILIALAMLAKEGLPHKGLLGWGGGGLVVLGIMLTLLRVLL